jgi:membrane protein DedA with SNARE-associated domain
MISELSQWMLDFINSAGYLGLFGAMFIEGIITPIPSELIVPFAGHLASIGEMNIVLVVLAATFGSTAGSTVSYFIAQKLGRPFFKRYGKYIAVDDEVLEKADHFFASRGRISVLLGQIVPGIRSIISYPAGIAKMDIKLFILLTFMGGLIWNTILATVGYQLGDQWMTFWNSLEGWDLVILVGLAIAVVSYLIWSRKKKKDRKAKEKNLP